MELLRRPIATNSSARAREASIRSRQGGSAGGTGGEREREGAGERGRGGESKTRKSPHFDLLCLDSVPIACPQLLDCKRPTRETGGSGGCCDDFRSLTNYC